MISNLVLLPYFTDEKTSIKQGYTRQIIGPKQTLILKKGMITHSSILAWRIPWIEKLGGLQSMGVHKESNTAE